MNHIKENWTTGEVFKASDLNEIARTLNALVDKHESIINDAAPSDESAYSSNKIIEAADAAKASVINDEQASVDSTFSSSKILEAINGAKFKTVIADELPETGKENTLYIVPSKDIPEQVYAGSALMYKDENDITSTDLYHMEGPIEGLSIGDVFKYKKPIIDTTSQTFVGTGLQNDYEESQYRVYFYSEMETGNYNIGDTFKVTSPNGNDILITSYGNVRINDSDEIIGVNSYITIEANKVYRLTGYQKIQDDDVKDYRVMDHDIYIASFEEVEGASSGNYTINRLGSMFMKNKPAVKQYILSEIDKSELNCSIDYDQTYDVLIKLIGGVYGTIELQDGHYYKLVDRYLLKLKNVSGNYYAPMIMEGRVGIEALVYEEVYNPSVVKYDNAAYIPGANILEGCIYGGELKMDIIVINSSNEYQLYPSFFTVTEGIIINTPNAMKPGDIIKITKDNPSNTLYVVEEVDDESLSVSKENAYINGIIRARVYSKNEYYRYTGKHRCDTGGFEEMASCYLYTFEKVNGVTTADYELEGIPGGYVGYEITKTINDKWLWVNGEWELLSAAEINIDDNN